MITAVTTKKKRSDLPRFRRILRPRQQLRCLAEFDEDELDFDSRKNSRAAAERESESEDNRERNKLKLVLKLPPVHKSSKVEVKRHVSKPELSESTSGSETSASEEESEEDEIVKPLKKRRVERTRDLSCGSGQREESKRNVIRRPIRSASGTPMPKMSYLEVILDKLQMKDTYRVFAQPVNPEELPDYHDVIERPMDFGTVRRKLVSRWYRTFEQFEDDVFLICSNAMQYNAPDTIYFNQAHSIQDMARSKFREIRANQMSSRAERKYEENIRPVHTGKNMEKNTQSVNAAKHSGHDRSYIHKKSTEQNDRRDVLKPLGHAVISKQKKTLKTIFEKKRETSKVYSSSMIKEMSKRPSDASYTEKTPRKPQCKFDVDTKEAQNSEFLDKKLIRKPDFNIATAPRSSGSKKTHHRTDTKPPDADKDQLRPRKLDTDSHITGKKPVLHRPHSKTEFIGSGVKLEDISSVGNTSLKKHQSKNDPESFGSDILFQEKNFQKQHQNRTEPESLASDHKSVKKPQFNSNPQENKIQYHPCKFEPGLLGSNHKSLKKFRSKREPESFGFDISLKKCKTRTEYPSRDEPESLGLDYRSIKTHSNISIEKKTEIDQPRTELESLSSDLSSPKKPQTEREPESFGSYVSSQTRKTHIDHISRAEPESLGSDNTSLEKPQSKGVPQSSGSYVSSQEKRTQIEHPSGTEPESHGSDFSSAVTLATSDDTLTGLSKKQAIRNSLCSELIAQDVATCTKFTKVDKSAAVNVSAEASFLLDESSEDEDDTPAKSSPSKHTHNPIVVDLNRRATYSKYEEEPTTTAHPIFDALDDETRELVSVSPKSEHSYARSLARFAFQLGPIGWDIASQKIKQCLPPEVKFGPGWVGEHEHLSTSILSFQNSSKNTRNGLNGSSTTTSTSNKVNHPPHNLPKAQNICFRSSEKPNPQPVISSRGWTQVQNGTRKQDKNIKKSASPAAAVLPQGWTQVQNNVTPLIKVKAEPNTDDSPNALPTAYANLQKNQLSFQSHKSSEINFSRAQPQYNYPQFGTQYWQPNVLSTSNAAISPTAPNVRVPNGATAKWKRSIQTPSSCVIEGGANARHEFPRGVMDNNNNNSKAQQQSRRLFVFPDLNLNFQPPVSPTFSTLDSQQQPDLALQL